MGDQEQPFAAFMLDALMHEGVELGQQWAERTWLAAVYADEPDNSTSRGTTVGGGLKHLVQTLLAAVRDGLEQHDSLVQTAAAIGAAAHRRGASLHLMLKELDHLGALLLQRAEHVASRYEARGTGHEGLAIARRITDAIVQFRLAAILGYTQATENELRAQYQAIRHDLRNRLATIKSAVALLTDDGAQVDAHETQRVRAIVMRNANSLDQLIAGALANTAARLSAVGALYAPTDLHAPIDLASEPSASVREQRDDVTRARQRSDLKSGTL
jgi:K+-sensing histidine kinase KdpD